jgi:hypothetical protein
MERLLIGNKSSRLQSRLNASVADLQTNVFAVIILLTFAQVFEEQMLHGE